MAVKHPGMVLSPRFVLVFCLYILFLFSREATADSPASAEKTKAPAVSTLTPTQMKGDLDFLMKTVLPAHPDPYAYIARGDFEKIVADTYQAVQQPLTVDEFYLRAEFLLASLRNGHTQLRIPQGWGGRVHGGKLFPLLMRVEKQRVYLLAYYGKEPLPIGSEIVSIQGRPAISVAKQVAAYFPKEGKEGNDAYLELPNMIWFCLALEFRNVQELSMEIKDKTGKKTAWRIPAAPLKEVLKQLKRSSTTTARSSMPPLEYTYREQDKTGLLTVNVFGNDLEFKTLVKGIFLDLKSKKVKNLVIDARQCPGGNSQLADFLLDYLTDKPWRQFTMVTIKFSDLYIEQRNPKFFLWRPKNGKVVTDTPLFTWPSFNTCRFHGKIYLLIGPQSYSTTTSFAAVVKHLKIGTLIGEETGDTITCYGDVLNYSLPNSGLNGIVSSKHFVGAGCSRPGQGVLPDYQVRATQKEMAEGCDSALDFTWNLIRGK